ncbi:acid phosphatase [Encephalitozoon hellem]|uniref:Acid phosphatase n=2 Tax=Encephalitozoon hellem TaxID=27973 RepID=A0A9Q9C3I3_ENCHE|nr:lysophosphatidic acid phosphatase type 6 [Encephalitozoon hellem]WEL38958.1 acid phosphatase [Encephalitozoon hellem]
MSLLFGGGRDTRNISTEKDLEQFRRYCQSGYKFIPKAENYNLEKLFVIFRHGARAPTRNLTRAWEGQECMSCNLNNSMISDCKRKECSEGDLTYRGFKQMDTLGKFIKNNYKSLLFDKKIEQGSIKMRATKVPRTHSSLAGVIRGLTGDTVLQNVEIPVSDDTLLNTLGCTSQKEKEDVTAFFDKPNIIQDNHAFNRHPRPQERVDHYYTSLCSRVQVDCKELNCDIKSVEEHIKAANDAWEYLANIGGSTDERRKTTFGRFARDLLLDIGEEKYIFLYSAHDSSMSAVLTGLDTGISEWPSYASALFIEVWCNMGKQYVRMVFNDRVVRPKSFPSDYIPIREFMGFLKKTIPSAPDKNPEKPDSKDTRDDTDTEEKIEKNEGAAKTNPA